MRGRCCNVVKGFSSRTNALPSSAARAGEKTPAPSLGADDGYRGAKRPTGLVIEAFGNLVPACVRRFAIDSLNRPTCAAELMTRAWTPRARPSFASARTAREHRIGGSRKIRTRPRASPRADDLAALVDAVGAHARAAAATSHSLDFLGSREVSGIWKRTQIHMDHVPGAGTADRRRRRAGEEPNSVETTIANNVRMLQNKNLQLRDSSTAEVGALARLDARVLRD